MKKIYVEEVITLFLMVLFLYSGLEKLVDFERFKVNLGNSPLAGASGVLSVAIPSIEILLLPLLSNPRSRYVGLWCTLGLLTAFAGYVIWVLSFSRHIPCACGGMIEHLNWHQHLLFNLLFVTMTAVGLHLEHRTKFTIDSKL